MGRCGQALDFLSPLMVVVVEAVVVLCGDGGDDSGGSGGGGSGSGWWLHLRLCIFLAAAASALVDYTGAGRTAAAMKLNMV